MRIYALVLILAHTPEEQQVETGSRLLYPHMYDDNDPDKDFKLDDMVELDDYEEDEVGQYIWSVEELPESFKELEIEALVTPDGKWHDTDQMPDDPDWVRNARRLLKKSPGCIGVKFVVHV